MDTTVSPIDIFYIHRHNEGALGETTFVMNYRQSAPHPHEKMLIFVHIQKTAGSNLQAIFHKEYPVSQLLRFNWYEHQTTEKAVEAFLSIPESQRRAVRVLYGHMYFGYHHYIPQPSTYFTLLREPVEQVISYYFYHKKLFPDQFGTFEAFISQSLEADNFQTRILSAQDGTSSFPPFGCCTVEMLERAKRHLEEHFSVVGLTERFDETLLLLKLAFGWGNPWYLRANVNKKRPRRQEIDPKLIEIIRQNNTLDIALYQHAQKLFERQIFQQPELFHSELKRFRLINRTVYPLYCQAGWWLRSIGEQVGIKQ